jgi:hypothetical protein
VAVVRWAENHFQQVVQLEQLVAQVPLAYCFLVQLEYLPQPIDDLSSSFLYDQE